MERQQKTPEKFEQHVEIKPLYKGGFYLLILQHQKQKKLTLFNA